MKEYIVRADIVKLANEIKDNFAPLHRAVIDAFIYNIETNIPAADVVEVRHAEWCTQLVSHHDTFNAYSHICKECGYFYKDTRFNGHNYCPNCGIKMEGAMNNGNL